MLFIRYVALAAVMVAVAACSRKNDGTATSKRIGEKAGETLSDFASGVGKGIDKKQEVEPKIGSAVRKYFEPSIAKLGEPGKKTLAVYLICLETFDGTLIAKATDEKGREIGRSVVSVSRQKGAADYVQFKFPELMDTLLVKEYSIDVFEG